MLFHSFTKSSLNDLMSAKEALSMRYLSLKPQTAFRTFSAAASALPLDNVVGVGVGEMLDGDKSTGVLAVKIFVRRKYALSELRKKDVLPKTLDGLPVDVEQIGTVRAFAAKKKAPGGAPAGPMPNPKQRFRPAQPGSSVGFRFPPPNQNARMAGTFGALVKDNSGTYILSNNHVLADEGSLPQGADIFQPGLLDGGSVTADMVAKLSRFVPITTAGMNKVDAALAKQNSAGLLSRDILHIGAPAGTAPAAFDQRVHKFGRTTSYTAGRITSIATDVTVQYEVGLCTFEDQIIIVGDTGSFSAAGDSGSLILDRQTNKAVGLLFAGSASHTIANHIGDVLSALGVTLV